jgi:hypothetical protein
MPTHNPEAIRQRAIAAARQRYGRPATPRLDPVFAVLDPGALPPAHDHQPSCTSGSAARSSTRPWAPTWWSSCTAKATPASPPPEPGRSSAGPTQPPAGRPTHQPRRPPSRRPSRPHQPVPATPGAGDGGRCSLTPPAPTSRTASRGSTPVVQLYVPGSWLKAPLGYESFERRSGACSSDPRAAVDQGMGRFPTGCRPGPSQALTSGPVSKP